METINIVILVKKGGAFLLSGPVYGDLSIIPVQTIQELSNLIAPQNVAQKVEMDKMVLFNLKNRP